jgi:hypothetical protein
VTTNPGGDGEPARGELPPGWPPCRPPTRRQRDGCPQTIELSACLSLFGLTGHAVSSIVPNQWWFSLGTNDPICGARCICQTEPVKTLTFEEEAERLRDFDTEEPRVIISGNSANPGCRSKAEPAAFARNAI